MRVKWDIIIVSIGTSDSPVISNEGERIMLRAYLEFRPKPVLEEGLFLGNDSSL